MRIVFCPVCPTEVKDAILPLLEKWSWIVPSWVHDCKVFFVDDNSAKLSITVRESNRDALLNVHPDWLMDTDYRESAVVHELCHCYSTPMQKVGEEYIRQNPDYPTPGTKMTEFALTEALERMTCDLAELMMRIIASAEFNRAESEKE